MSEFFLYFKIIKSHIYQREWTNIQKGLVDGFFDLCLCISTVFGLKYIQFSPLLLGQKFELMNWTLKSMGNR